MPKFMGARENAPFRLEFGADGRPVTDTWRASDQIANVLDASANAKHLVKAHAARSDIGVLDGPGWIEGVLVRDIC